MRSTTLPRAATRKDVRGDKMLRDQAVRQAYLEYGYSMAAIAESAGIHYSTVSKIIKGER